MILYLGHSEKLVIRFGDGVFNLNIPLYNDNNTHDKTAVLGVAQLGKMVLSHGDDNGSDNRTSILGVAQLGQMVLA